MPHILYLVPTYMVGDNLPFAGLWRGDCVANLHGWAGDAVTNLHGWAGVADLTLNALLIVHHIGFNVKPNAISRFSTSRTP